LSSLRIGGLASGMDIDSIINDLMKVERIPLDKLKQQKQLLEWKKEDYLEINRKLMELRNSAFNLKLESAFNAKIATSSNEDAVGVSAGGSAVPGIYTVTVHQRAEGVFKASTSKLADESNGSSTKTLYEQFKTEFDARGLTSSDTITFTLNGTGFSFDLGTDNIYTVVSKINNADIGVTASYDAELDRFFLTTTTTGSNAEITVTSDSADFISNGTNTSILKLNIDEGTTYNGQDALYDFGDATGLISSTNTATINGLTLEFKQGGSVTSTITVTNDTDTVFNTIKEFVDLYNETLELINSKLWEERYRDYPPLTDAQKEEMTEKEIELWEEKARSGLLQNDSLLRSIVGDMRLTMAGVVENLNGQYDSLDDIGITTRLWQEYGKLYIDEDKLQEALEKNLDSVKELFTKNSDVENEKGVAERLYDILDTGIDRIADRAGIESGFSLVDNSYLGKKIRDMNQNIEEWEDRLVEIENRYWREFTMMEKAINQMNMQSMWLMQQFGSNMWM